jgi:hypothetical protein
MIRIDEVCNGDNETTVLCHLNGSYNLGGKNDDIHAAFGCSSCHDEVDRRTQHVSDAYAKAMFHVGVFNTQKYWIKNGYLTWSGATVRRKDARATERLIVWIKSVAGKSV